MTRWLAVLGIFIAALTLPSVIQADTTGNEVYGDCLEQHGTAHSWFCLGYIGGVGDTLVMSKMICTPSGVTYGQLVDIAQKYFQEHPETRNQAAVDLIFDAFRHSFPCPNLN